VSLRLRLSLTFAAVVALVVAVLGVLLYVTMAKTLAVEMDRRLQVRADEVALALWPGPDTPTIGDLQPGKVDVSPLGQLGATNVRVHVLGASGQRLATFPIGAGSTAPIAQHGVSLATSGRTDLSDVQLSNGDPARALSQPINVHGRVAGVLQVIQPREVLAETLSGLRSLLLLLGGLAIAVAGAAGWFVSYRGLQPLSAISQQAGQIASKADFGLRIGAPKRRDEIGRLAGTMDQLLEKVDETLRAHRDFVADTSHELRNPLLAIRTNLDLLDRVRSADDREECIREATGQAARMSRLVSDLLVLAQVENRLLLDPHPLDVAAVAERAVHQALPRTTGQTLTLDATSPAEVTGDEGRLDQVFENLLDNAIKHTPAGGTITVRVAAQTGGATVSVEDTGEGIAAEHLPHVFDRAFRAPNGRASGGYGLGLAIVRRLVEAHGGRVEATSQPGKGTRISLWLPERAGEGQGT
jgi:two-component system, OmpR family, sensor kinase